MIIKLNLKSTKTSWLKLNLLRYVMEKNLCSRIRKAYLTLVMKCTQDGVNVNELYVRNLPIIYSGHKGRFSGISYMSCEQAHQRGYMFTRQPTVTNVWKNTMASLKICNESRMVSDPRIFQYQWQSTCLMKGVTIHMGSNISKSLLCFLSADEQLELVGLW